VQEDECEAVRGKGMVGVEVADNPRGSFGEVKTPLKKWGKQKICKHHVPSRGILI
jgi:hypothetical protein